VEKKRKRGGLDIVVGKKGERTGRKRKKGGVKKKKAAGWRRFSLKEQREGRALGKKERSALEL